ncbi:MAG: hypothetical protein WC980_03840 [Candidatus Brocadiia bacterium]
MKTINRIMLAVRILAGLIIVLLALDYWQNWGLIQNLMAVRLGIVIFAVVYLFGSILQIMLRFKAQQHRE